METLMHEKLTGLCEYMPAPEREERELLLLQLIEAELIEAGGALEFEAALTAVAGKHRIAVSQVKHGLNRGIALQRLILTTPASFEEPLILTLQEVSHAHSSR